MERLTSIACAMMRAAGFSKIAMRLVREVGKQGDLLFGKWAYLLAVEQKIADQFPVFEHRHYDEGYKR